ncbi:hypothetical protein AMTRI_Chr03g148690 [Amborella trichopoda]
MASSWILTALLFLFLVVSPLLALSKRDPERERQERQCKSECERSRERESEVRQCKQECEERYRREKGQGRNIEERERESESESEGRRRGVTGNPYAFERDRFVRDISTEHGSFRTLPPFTERSELFRGIENNRICIMELKPNAFVLPHHKDADIIYYVANGDARLVTIGEERQDSHNLKKGDTATIPAGKTTYIINKDSQRELKIVALLQTISTPGQYEIFFGATGQNPPSYLRAFSDEILEASFNVDRSRLSRLLEQKGQGPIVRPSSEQLQGLIHGGSGGGKWPFGESEESERPFNLFSRRPRISNDHGELYELDETEYSPLREFDIAISFANISRGSLEVPFYNSRATEIYVILEGRARIEMACPHVSGGREQEGSRRGQGEQEGSRGGQREQEGSRREQEQEERGKGQGQEIKYHKIRSDLNPEDLFVAPPSHPIAIRASQEENLQIISFEINARRNRKYFLAGKNSILNQIERAAKEVSFNVPSREAEEVLRAQSDSVFVVGPRQQREGREGEGRAVA